MTITLGTQFEVDPDGSSPSSNFNVVAIVRLTDTTAIGLYSDNTNGLQARHLTNSGGTLSKGAAVTITASYARYVEATRLDATNVLVVWGIQSTDFVAIVLTVSGTTITAHTGDQISLTENNVTSISLDVINSTTAIYAYRDTGNFGVGKARIITVSGTTPTENASFTFNGVATDAPAVAIITASTAIVSWYDNGTGNVHGEILDISGTTITGNTSYDFSKAGVTNALWRWLSVDIITSTTYMVVYRNSGATSVNSFVISNAATVLSAGVTTQLLSTAGASQNAVSMLSATVGMAIAMSSANINWIEFAISGTSISVTDTDALTQPDGWGDMVALDAEDTISIWHDTTDTPETTEAITATVPAASALALAPMTKPADVDADGSNIYIALLDSGNPIVIKISTDLASDASEIFTPGAGDNIGVQCGRFDSDVVWIAGAFAGTDVIALSEDGGTTFTTKDDGTFEHVEAFVVGPDSDERVLIIGETPFKIRQTIDNGDSWEVVNAAFPKTSNTMARLPKNVQEIAIGSDKTGANVINYSVNSGDDVEDITTGSFPDASDVTSVLVN